MRRAWIGTVVVLAILVIAVVAARGKDSALPPRTYRRRRAGDAPCRKDALNCTKCDYGTICNKKYNACLGGFGGAGDAVRLHSDPVGPDSSWMFIPHGDGTFHICDKTDNCLVAGLGGNDGIVHHQRVNFDQPQGQWTIVPAVAGGGVNICNAMYPGNCIAASEAYNDGWARLQPPGGRDVAVWKIGGGNCY